MIVWSMSVSSKHHTGTFYFGFPGADRLVLFLTGASVIFSLLLLSCIFRKLGTPSAMLGADIELVPFTT
jgi:hypothetical protein